MALQGVAASIDPCQVSLAAEANDKMDLQHCRFRQDTIVHYKPTGRMRKLTKAAACQLPFGLVTNRYLKVVEYPLQPTVIDGATFQDGRQTCCIVGLPGLVQYVLDMMRTIVRVQYLLAVCANYQFDIDDE